MFNWLIIYFWIDLDVNKSVKINVESFVSKSIVGVDSSAQVKTIVENTVTNGLQLIKFTGKLNRLIKWIPLTINCLVSYLTGYSIKATLRENFANFQNVILKDM